MKVLRIAMSGAIERQRWMRSRVLSTAPGRFMSLSTRGLACWNGMSRYGSSLALVRYSVTMREPGVSRLVSVDLAEAARLAGAA